MRFLFCKESGVEFLYLKNEEFSHLKVRRVKEKDIIYLRNLKDNFLYSYEILEITKKFYALKLIRKEEKITTKTHFTLALAVIDPKILEKTLPFLNELGVDKLILVYTQYSQKNFKIDFKRCERIIIQSCEQCGRSYMMQIELFNNIEEFLEKYQNVVLVDFSGEKKEFFKNNIYFIGPEGGFSEEEIQIFKNKISLNTPNILRAHSAALAISSKVLL
ncbi:16S rRNA (uracil(1498)-N(3))-methyltransferase [Campylobacter sp. TTU-622]|uniref:16S rRNA (uracil(1498)-N(3))-methyltransferase n=1 Tax=unclassified Campylobacter TaxID=2593542 RepID=UPI001906F9DF|nr:MULTISPECIES: 16S rRNA (uracil(1498)-N(3))-methyltransferase [unclassified Campylobacter]MBK1971920.1 16S rRNA (uracil(1498)-N(3))-methyltransferase [Campylobacter sp. TTU_617]MBK1973970.1 16S rRNA (uracil(1498)-N(3))-methyltransferase [Campylobacter sp. TTU-622]MBK1991537.1 16S rRNA (uracil(1498)-N(3))-methyltransferase [Campylobacter sp. 2018MI34]